MTNLEEYRCGIAKINEIFDCGSCGGENCNGCQKWDEIKMLKERLGRG